MTAELPLLVFGVAAAVTLGLLYITKTLRTPLWGLLALLFFVPFERFPTIQTGAFLLRISHLVGGLLLLCFFALVAISKRRLIANPLAPYILLFLFTLVLSFTQSVELGRSIQIFIFTLFTVAMALLVPQFVRTKNDLTKVVLVLLGATALMVLVAYWQFIGDMAGLPQTLTGINLGYSKIVFGFPRPHAFSPEPLYFGSFLFGGLSVGLSLWLSGMRRWRAVWPFVLAAGVMLALTLSRGAIIGFTGALLLLGVAYGKQLFRFKTLGWAGLTLVFAFAAFALILNTLGPERQQKFLDQLTIKDYGTSESTVARLNAYQTALDAWQTSPYLGIGLGNFGPYVAHYQDLPPDKPGYDIVNNQFLETLAETGIIGLFAFALMFVMLFLRSWQAAARADPFTKAVIIGLCAAMFGTLAQMNFFSTLYILHIWILIGLLIAAQNVALGVRGIER